MRVDNRTVASRHHIVLIAALLSSCVGAPARPAASSPLVGEWRSGCTRIGKGGRHGAIFAVRFDGQGQMLASTRMFAQADCVHPTVQLEVAADYELGARSGSGVAIDYIFHRAEMTLLSAEVAAIYNSEAFVRCARSEWRPGVPQSVLGGFCPPIRMPSGGTVHRDAAFLGGETVAFGDFPLGLEATADAVRPASPSQVVFAKVPPASAIPARSRW